MLDCFSLGVAGLSPLLPATIATGRRGSKLGQCFFAVRIGRHANVRQMAAPVAMTSSVGRIVWPDDARAFVCLRLGMQDCFQGFQGLTAGRCLPTGCAVRDNLQAINGAFMRFVVFDLRPSFRLFLGFKNLPNDSCLFLQCVEIPAMTEHDKKRVKRDFLQGALPLAVHGAGFHARGESDGGRRMSKNIFN